jgi:hypothetical protein
MAQLQFVKKQMSGYRILLDLIWFYSKNQM